MPTVSDEKTNEQLRQLPAINQILESGSAQKTALELGEETAVKFARIALDELRSEILSGAAADSRGGLLALAIEKFERVAGSERRSGLRRAINATGVIIHTNLGRAPLSENAVNALVENASGYCNLEFDLETGKRGRRGRRAENLLAELTGAEDALIVNNCAAAAILVLTALAKGGEAVVSRGELVEIGGDFRVPDVMAQSGAIMKEVGTTNRTKLADYEHEITFNTALLVKVHPSNYRIVGFTSVPTVKEMADLAHENGIRLYEDAGSGALVDLSEFGLTDEPLIKRSIADGADVVTFSGDKLLGSAQAGLIVGKKDAIEILRKHPFYRALRASKIIYAVLEATLESFKRGKHFDEIPVLRMISTSESELEKRVTGLAAKLNEISSLSAAVIEGRSVIGGGSAPMAQPASKVLALTHEKLSVNELEEKLRLSDPPVITRIEEDKVLIDLRTVSNAEVDVLLEVFAQLD
ncbi:MAG: L-seryl-tRNA(Sec) selenium transferase [Pyrinomonadaceae bacterium]|nr:L-seryl-tRNA(Sec) selenium transferase [Pyrinomonadaceae bacterium]